MDKEQKLKDIFNRARRDIKGDYSIYHNYRRLLEELELDPMEFETAVRKLVCLLRV